MVKRFHMLMRCLAHAAGAGDVGDSEQGSAKPTPTSSPQKDLPAARPAVSKGLVPTNPTDSTALTHAWHPSLTFYANCSIHMLLVVACWVTASLNLLPLLLRSTVSVAPCFAFQVRPMPCCFCQTMLVSCQK